MKLTPKMVSGRVVKISNFRSESFTSNLTSAPCERPIQLRWMSFKESDQSMLSSPSSNLWA